MGRERRVERRPEGEMAVTKRITLAGLSLTIALLGQEARGDGRTLRVRLAPAQMTPVILGSAKLTVTRIFEQAGIQLEWARLRVRTVAAPIADCMDRGLDTIDAEIIDHAPSGLSVKALGVAQPFTSSGMRVWLFKDRLDGLTRSYHQTDAGRVVGHALAHEIGHVLIGGVTHSESGLMAAHWDNRIIAEILHGKVRFTAAEIAAIHYNLDNPRRCSEPAIVSEAIPSLHSSLLTQTVARARD